MKESPAAITAERRSRLAARLSTAGVYACQGPRRGMRSTEEGTMIIRSVDEVRGTDRDVHGDRWQSRRLLLARDGMGFSLHDTVVEAGADLEIEYRHHLEACYVMSGSAEVTDLSSGSTAHLGPGIMYALDQHDRHRIRVSEELRLVCVFNPALAGAETHDAEGGFPAGG